MGSRTLRRIEAQVTVKEPALQGKWRFGCKLGYNSVVPPPPHPPSTPQDTLWGDIKQGLEAYAHYPKQTDLYLTLEYTKPQRRPFKYPLRWSKGVEASQRLDN